MSPNQVQLIRGAFAIHGLKIKKRPLGFMWDGETEAWQDDASNMLHDLAHWTVATPARRKMREFGLGPGPETKYGLDCPAIVTGKMRDDEEAKASLLGIVFLIRLGFPWLETLEYHSWTSTNPAPALKALGRLVTATERARIIKACA